MNAQEACYDALNALSQRLAGAARIIKATPSDQMRGTLVTELHNLLDQSWSDADTALDEYALAARQTPRQSTVHEFIREPEGALP